MAGLRTKLETRVAHAVALLAHRGDVRVGEGVLAFGVPLINAAPGGSISIGDGVRLVSTDRATPLGVNHRVVIRALRAGADVRIGARTAISGGSICAAASVRIGSGCLLGANVSVFDTDFHPIHALSRVTADLPPSRDADHVVIGDNVFLGTGSIIAKGVHIGDNSVVGAGSVVTRGCPPNTILAGNPARPVGMVDAPV